MASNDTRRYPVALLVAAGLTFFSSAVQAAGYAIKEQSSTAQGNAFAGATAGAEDISYMFFNLAGLTRHQGHQTHLSLSYVAPRSKFKNGSASTVLNTPIDGTNNADDIAEDALIPAFYGMTSFGEDIRLGLGVNVPFGLTTENEDGWIGRYHALDSRLKSININPTVAMRVTPWLSFGMGAQIQYLDTRLTNAIDFGTVGTVAGVPGSVPTAQDGKVKVNGDDWSSGLNLGIMVEPTTSTRFGLGFRSEIEHDLTGNANFRLDSAGTGAALSAATGRFVDTNAQAEVTTPASVSFGAYHDINEHWAVMAEAAWTDWSKFEEIKIEFDNPNEPDNVTEQDWDDTFFVALGMTWRPIDPLALRLGAAYDESPISDDFRTPRLPAEDRYWTSFGLDYEPAEWFGLNASFTHIFVDSGDIRLTTDGTDNTFRGNLSGRYENRINIATIGATFRF